MFRITFRGTGLRVIVYFICFFTHKTGNVLWQQVIRVVDHGKPLPMAITCVHSAKSIKYKGYSRKRTKGRSSNFRPNIMFSILEDLSHQ